MCYFIVKNNIKQRIVCYFSIKQEISCFIAENTKMSVDLPNYQFITDLWHKMP